MCAPDANGLLHVPVGSHCSASKTELKRTDGRFKPTTSILLKVEFKKSLLTLTYRKSGITSVCTCMYSESYTSVMLWKPSMYFQNYRP